MMGFRLQLAHAYAADCDVIQYECGGPPWKTWPNMPPVPVEHLAAGPWVCLGQLADEDAPCARSWVWARALTIDTAAIEQRQRDDAERAAEDAERGVVKRAAARLLADLERVCETVPAEVKVGLEAAAVSGLRNVASSALSHGRIQDLRAIAKPLRVRAARHADLRVQLVSAYIYRAEAEEG